ncbi:MAG: hypothetical protein C4583_15875 [Anaerolineaceae bacterium]|nr:MAG: hypothetical protein C4583_15875 [Anaerolineaceae bacterium]
METTGKQFVEFWTWASQKGLMNENTAYSFSSPVKQIISINDGWEEVDVRKLDVDVLLSQFQNLKGKNFKPNSLNTYFRRFKLALDMFLEYVDNPTGWKYKGQIAQNRKPKNAKAAEKGTQKESGFEMPVTQSDDAVQMVDYPFPLREGCIVRLKLPVDLKAAEVERLTNFMRSIVLE